MKYIIGVQLIFSLFITEITFGQSVTTVPSDTGNDRFMTEFQSVIRPGLSLNGFDNGGNDSKGLGLKQVLNLALAGDPYINAKLEDIFDVSGIPLARTNPNNEDIEENSRILQYTAFEALASFVLQHNGFLPGLPSQTNWNIRSHLAAMADLKSKLLFVSSYTITQVQGGASQRVRDERMIKQDSDYVKNVKSF